MKLICLVMLILAHQFAGADASSGEAFIFNHAGHLLMPLSSSYGSLSEGSRQRFQLLLGQPVLTDRLNPKLLELYAHNKMQLDRLNQVGSRRQREQAQEMLNRSYRALLGELSSLKYQEPQIFHQLRQISELNLDLSDGSERELPSFCAYYPVLNKQDLALYFSGEGVDQQQEVYRRNCGADQKRAFSIDLKTVVNTLEDLETKNHRHQEEKAREQLMALISRKLMRKSFDYHNIFDHEEWTQNKKLASCLRQKREDYPHYHQAVLDEYQQLQNKEIERKQQERGRQQQLQEEFIKFHASQAILAQAHLQRQDELDVMVEQERQKKTVSRRCARTGRSGTTKSCAAIRRAKKERRLALDQAIAQNQQALEKLMKEAPLLFQVNNEMKLEKVSLVNIKLAPSPLMTQILGRPQAKQVSRAVASMGGLEQLGKERPGLLKDYLKSVIQDQQLKKAAKQAIRRQAQEINQGLTSICRQEGAYLHHYTYAFDDLFAKLAENPKGEEARQDIIATQAGLCSLWRRRPPNGGAGYYGGLADGGARYYAGLAIGVVGLSMGPTPWGGAMAASGGLLMGYDVIDTYREAAMRESVAQSMLGTSWGDVREFMDSTSQRYHELNEGVIEFGLAFGLVGAAGVKTSTSMAVHRLRAPRLRRERLKERIDDVTKRRRGGDRRLTQRSPDPHQQRRQNHIQEKAVNELHQKLGSDKKLLMAIYLPSDMPRLSFTEETYFAGLAQELERQALSDRRNYNFLGRVKKDQVQEQVQRQLNDILKQCKKRK